MTQRPNIELQQLDTMAQELATTYGQRFDLFERGQEYELRMNFPGGEHIELTYRSPEDWQITTEDNEANTQDSDSEQIRIFHRYENGLYGNSPARVYALLALISLREQIELTETPPMA